MGICGDRGLGARLSGRVGSLWWRSWYVMQRQILTHGDASTFSTVDGWVYTNDAWLNPRPAPNAEWQKSGMTRRRRWVRRIYPIALT
jgi:hypothetical protein